MGFAFAQTGQLSILGRWSRTAKLQCCAGKLFKMVRSTRRALDLLRMSIRHSCSDLVIWFSNGPIALTKFGRAPHVNPGHVPVSIPVSVWAVLLCKSTHGGAQVSRAGSPVFMGVSSRSGMLVQNRADPPQTALINPRLRRMNEKPMTVTQMSRMGGIARAKAHSKAELRARHE